MHIRAAQFNNSNYRIKYNAPENCEEATCDYFVAITTNKEDPKFLDFLIEGKAQGWVAIGFSTDGKMVSFISITYNIDIYAKGKQAYICMNIFCSTHWPRYKKEVPYP